MELAVRSETGVHLAGYLAVHSLEVISRCRCMDPNHHKNPRVMELSQLPFLIKDGMKIPVRPKADTTLTLDVAIFEDDRGQRIAINAHELGVECLLKIPTFRTPTLEELKAELKAGTKRWKK